jgi:phosphoribosylglycinamide formyltransferase-1
LLAHYDVDLIALAGYMKRVPSKVIERFRNRILNIHPALLPKFGGTGMYGIHVHEAVLAAGEKVSGATVHIVDEEYDHGAIVVQKTVEVSANDTPETLAAKVLKIEHEIYPQALAAFATGRVHIEGRRAWIQ